MWIKILCFYVSVYVLHIYFSFATVTIIEYIIFCCPKKSPYSKKAKAYLIIILFFSAMTQCLFHYPLVMFCLSGTINSEFADALYLIILSWLLSFCCPLWYAVNPHGVPTDNWRDCIPLHWESIAKRYWADILLAVERIFSDKFQTYPTIVMSIMQLSRMIIVNLY